MEANKILSADLLDIIFDERNKSYGAYELRRTYERRIKKSLFITGGITVLVFAGTVLASNSKNSGPIEVPVTEMILQSVPDEIPIPPPEETPPPQQQEPVRTEVLLPPVLADEVETPPVAQQVFDQAAIGSQRNDGPTDDGPTEITPPGNGTGIIQAPVQDDPPGIWEKVEVDAKFAGNWVKFLERNLDANVPVDHDAPAGRYTVKIKFVVDVDGTVSDIQPLTNLGYGLEQEAVRVLKKASKWEPAMQNGTYVKAYRVQLITFEVQTQE